MHLKKVNFVESLKINKCVFEEGKTIFMEDQPKVHNADGYLSISLDRDGVEGTFLQPSSMWNVPTTGNLIKRKMTSGREMYFLVTSWTQDHVSASGKIVRLCYVEDYHQYIEFARA